jgi:hypothetical protein
MRVLKWAQLGRRTPPSAVNSNITEVLMVYAKEAAVPQPCEKQLRRMRGECTIAGEMIAALRVDQARGESPQLAAAIEREQRSAELLQRRASTGRDELAAARAAWAALAAGGDVSSDDAALCAGSTRATLVDQRGRRLQAVDERSLAASAHEIAQTTLLVASEQTGRHERSVRQHLREFFVEATGRVPAEEDFARALAVGAASAIRRPGCCR